MDPLRIRVHTTSALTNNNNDCLFEAVMRSLYYQARGGRRHPWARRRVTAEDIVGLRNALADYIRGTPPLVALFADLGQNADREIRLIRGRGNQVGQTAIQGLALMLGERLLVLEDTTGGAHTTHRLGRGFPTVYGHLANAGGTPAFTDLALRLDAQVPLYITYYQGEPDPDDPDADIPGHFEPVDLPEERELADEVRVARADALVHAPVPRTLDPDPDDPPVPPPPYTIETLGGRTRARTRSLSAGAPSKQKQPKKKTKVPVELLPSPQPTEEGTPHVPMPDAVLPDLATSTTTTRGRMTNEELRRHRMAREAETERIAAEQRDKHPMRRYEKREMIQLRRGITTTHYQDTYGAPPAHWYDYRDTFTNDERGWQAAVATLDLTLGVGNWDDNQFDHLVQGRDSLSDWTLATVYRIEPDEARGSSGDEETSRFSKAARVTVEEEEAEVEEEERTEPTPTPTPTPIETPTPTPIAISPTPVVLPISQPTPTPVVQPAPVQPSLPLVPYLVSSPDITETHVPRTPAPHRPVLRPPNARIPLPRPEQIHAFREAIRNVFPEAPAVPNFLPGMWRTMEDMRDRLFRHTREQLNPRQILEAARRYAPAGASAYRALGEYAQAIQEQFADAASDTAALLASTGARAIGTGVGLAIGSAETALLSARDARNAVTDQYVPPPPRVPKPSPSPAPTRPSPPQPPPAARPSPQPAPPAPEPEPIPEPLPEPVTRPLRRPLVVAPTAPPAVVVPTTVRHPDEVIRGVLDGLHDPPRRNTRATTPSFNPEWDPTRPSDNTLTPPPLALLAPTATPGPKPRAQPLFAPSAHRPEEDQVNNLFRRAQAAKRRALTVPPAPSGPVPREVPEPLPVEEPLLTAEEDVGSVAGSSLHTADEDETQMETAIDDPDPQPPGDAPLFEDTTRLVPAYPHVAGSREDRKRLRTNLRAHLPEYAGRRAPQVQLPSGTSTSDAQNDLLVARTLRRGISYSRVVGRKLRGRPRKMTTPGDLLKSKTRTRELQQDPATTDDDVVVYTQRGVPTRGGEPNRARITTYRQYRESLAAFRERREDPEFEPFNAIILHGIRNTEQFQRMYGTRMTMTRARKLQRQFGVKLRTRRRAMEREAAQDEAQAELQDRRMVDDLMAEEDAEDERARVAERARRVAEEEERLRREEEEEAARRAEENDLRLTSSSESTDPETARQNTLRAMRAEHDARPKPPPPDARTLDRLQQRVLIRGRPGGTDDLVRGEGGILAEAAAKAGLGPESDSGSSAPPTPKPPPVRRRATTWVPGRDPPKPKAKPAPKPAPTPPPPSPVASPPPPVGAELLPVAVIPPPEVHEEDAAEMAMEIDTTDRVGEMPPDRIDTRIPRQAGFAAIRDTFVESGLWNRAQHLRRGDTPPPAVPLEQRWEYQMAHADLRFAINRNDRAAAAEARARLRRILPEPPN